MKRLIPISRQPDRARHDNRGSCFGKRKLRAEIVGPKAGRSGLVASIGMAMLGIGFGVLTAYVGGRGNQVNARYSGFKQITGSEMAQKEPLRTGLAPSFQPAAPGAQTIPQLREGTWRENVVREILEQSPTDLDNAAGATDVRQSVLHKRLNGKKQPMIAIIFDDMGLDPMAFDRLMAMPGPLTYSFLPYANHTATMAIQAKARGDGIFLHMPMEPVGVQDPGPHALSVGSSLAQFQSDLDWNLSQFDGYTGVNNHMGSRLTTNLPRMRLVLQALKERDLYFVDSVTTSKTIANKAAARVGTPFIRRDVFLDAQAGTQTVRRQLKQVETIAERTGFAVAIAHPRAATLDVIGPWLTSATVRGYTLVTMDELMQTLEQASIENIATEDIANDNDGPAIRG